MTTPAEIQSHKAFGPWRQLQSMAAQIVDQASTAAGSEMRPLLGGGTRIMLALAHRISDDIDLFIRDPQWIGYVSPRLNDSFEDFIDQYEESSSSLKLVFRRQGMTGEIDFIVGMSLLGLPPEKDSESPFDLEPIAEVLAKKLFYRGGMMTARDLFDWWFVEQRMNEDELHLQEIAKLISGRIPAIRSALNAMPGSSKFNEMWEGIRAANKPDLLECVAWAKRRLAWMETIAAAPPTPSSSPKPTI